VIWLVVAAVLVVSGLVLLVLSVDQRLERRAAARRRAASEPRQDMPEVPGSLFIPTEDQPPE
jgi:hypothetical protein